MTDAIIEILKLTKKNDKRNEYLSGNFKIFEHIEHRKSFVIKNSVLYLEIRND